jgi:hypothetical protein
MVVAPAFVAASSRRGLNGQRRAPVHVGYDLTGAMTLASS